MNSTVGSQLHRIEREPLSDLVYSQLRDTLLAGRVEPGSRLTLRSLAAMLGTSVTPVRDAVNRLVAQGVLHLGARATAIVPDITVQDLHEITIVRRELEGCATREAAKRATDQSCASLEKKLSRMNDLINRGQLDTYLDVHREFHFAVYRLAGLPLLNEMIENLWLRSGPILSFVIPDYVRLRKGTDKHIAVVRSMRSGDSEAAEAAIRADIQDAADYLSTLADKNGFIRRLS